MNNMAIYLIGFLLIIGGLAYGGYAVGLPPVAIGVGAVVLLGIGIVSAVSKTRLKESSPEDNDNKKVVVQESD